VNGVSTLIPVVDRGTLGGIEGCVLHVIPSGRSQYCPIDFDIQRTVQRDIFL